MTNPKHEILGIFEFRKKDIPLAIIVVLLILALPVVTGYSLMTKYDTILNSAAQRNQDLHDELLRLTETEGSLYYELNKIEIRIILKVEVDDMYIDSVEIRSRR